MTHVYLVANELEAARASYHLSKHHHAITRQADPGGTVRIAVEGALSAAVAAALLVEAPSARLHDAVTVGRAAGSAA